MTKTSVTDAVREIIDKIRDATSRRSQGVVSFEFTDDRQYITSRAIQSMLISKGYVVYVILGGKESRSDRLYIDMSRRFQRSDVAANS